MAMAHRQATGTPAERYITGLRELRARRLGPSTMLIVVDDVAASGDSLDDARQETARVYAGRIVLAPMISTRKAEDRFNGPRGISRRNPNTTYAPQKVMSALTSSQMMQRLPRAASNRILELLGSLGYGETGTSVAFPYMSPDNNNNWFADQLAKEFILDKSRRAVKVDWPWEPPAP